MNRNEDPAESYRRAIAAFEGSLLDAHELADRKMFSIVASSAGADTRITASEFSVHWPLRRDAFRYWTCFSPGLIATLRQHAPGGSFLRPFVLDAETVGRLGFFKNGPKWFWVSRTAEAITIACRQAELSAQPPAQPEPLAPWRPAENVFARYPRPRACLHCGARAERYRLVDDVLICAGCGRSQRITQEELYDAVLERAG